MKTYTLTLPDGNCVSIEVTPGVFVPTLTTQLCLNAVWTSGRRSRRTLDLGCGCGVVAIGAALSGCATAPVCASDISARAVDLARRNAQNQSIPSDIREGTLFAPWGGERFDLIVDDVSGIAEEVARISPWFGTEIPCASGEDGATLTCAVLAQAGGYLVPDGELLFPVISLSARDVILRKAADNFRTVEKVMESKWRLPAEMNPHANLLQALRKRGIIDYEELFGMIVCSTEVYSARLPLNPQ